MEKGMTAASLRIRTRMLLQRDLLSPEQRRALREAAGLSQDDIAEACGATRQAVSHWENGTRTPTGEYLEKYVSVLRTLREAS